MLYYSSLLRKDRFSTPSDAGESRVAVLLFFFPNSKIGCELVQQADVGGQIEDGVSSPDVTGIEGGGCELFPCDAQIVV